jgi:hypothetical protein
MGMDIEKRLQANLHFRLWALKQALSFISLALYARGRFPKEIASIIEQEDKRLAEKTAQSGPSSDDSDRR